MIARSVARRIWRPDLGLSSSGGNRLWRLGTALANPRFYVYAATQVQQAIGSLVLDFERRNDALRQVPSTNREMRRLLDRRDVFVSNYRRLHIGVGASINTGSTLVTPAEDETDEAAIWLGTGTYVGRRVELGVYRNNVMRIGDYTSINDDCVLLGDIAVENYCTLAYHIYMSSGRHYTTLHPQWLIRDQDAWAHGDPELSIRHHACIHIEEDTWIGWGVFISRGVYVGRGSVIGANAVVTHDVPPYSVQAGVPSREIGKRLTFQPPQEVLAVEEKHWPYFYAGFAMRQEDVTLARRHGVLFAGSRTRLVLQGGPFQVMHISGWLAPTVQALHLSVRCNGQLLGSVRVDQTLFSRHLDVQSDLPWTSQAIASQPSVLRAHNHVELEVMSVHHRDANGEPEPRGGYLYGVSSVLIQPGEASQQADAAPH